MLELEPAEWFDRLLFCAAQQKQIKVRGFHDSLIISALSKKVPNTNIELMQEIGKVYFWAKYLDSGTVWAYVCKTTAECFELIYFFSSRPSADKWIANVMVWGQFRF